MIREYALEPALLSNWKDLRYFAEKFSVPQGRLISEFPSHWKRLVYDACSQCDDVEKMRITEMMSTMGNRLMRRARAYDDKMSWVQNACDSHSKLRFHAILACAAIAGQPDVLVGDTVNDHQALWKEKRSMTIPRDPAAMADAAAPLLQISREVVFIDPNFKPSDINDRLPLEKFLEKLARCGGTTLTRLEYHVGDGQGAWKKSVAFADFERGCQQYLGRCVPVGFQLSFVRWKHTCLHNRFILTDRGLMQFGTGLDKATSTSTQDDQLTLLDEDDRLGLWKKHVTRACPTMVLADDPGQVVISGQRIVRALHPQTKYLSGGSNTTAQAYPGRDGVPLGR